MTSLSSRSNRAIAPVALISALVAAGISYARQPGRGKRDVPTGKETDATKVAIEDAPDTVASEGSVSSKDMSVKDNEECLNLNPTTPTYEVTTISEESGLRAQSTLRQWSWQRSWRLSTKRKVLKLIKIRR